MFFDKFLKEYRDDAFLLEEYEKCKETLHAMFPEETKEIAAKSKNKKNKRKKSANPDINSPSSEITQKLDDAKSNQNPDHDQDKIESSTNSPSKAEKEAAKKLRKKANREKKAEEKGKQDALLQQELTALNAEEAEEANALPFSVALSTEQVVIQQNIGVLASFAEQILEQKLPEITDTSHADTQEIIYYGKAFGSDFFESKNRCDASFISVSSGETTHEKGFFSSDEQTPSLGSEQDSTEGISFSIESDTIENKSEHSLENSSCSSFSGITIALEKSSEMPPEILPLSYTNNPKFKNPLDKISTVFKESDLEGYLYGGSNCKKDTNDLDILLPNIDPSEDRKKISELLLKLRNIGCKITINEDGTMGYKKTEPDLTILPMTLYDLKIELVVWEGNYTEHAKIMDFTVCAMYFNLKIQKMHLIESIDSLNDLNNKELNTVLEDSVAVFSEDPSRIFRGMRMIASEDYHFSEKCQNAIKELFSGSNNLFKTMKSGKLNQQLELIFSSSYEIMSKNIEQLHQMPLFDKLLICVSDIAEKYQKKLSYTEKSHPSYAQYQQMATAYSAYRDLFMLYRNYRDNAFFYEFESQKLLACQPQCGSFLEIQSIQAQMQNLQYHYARQQFEYNYQIHQLHYHYKMASLQDKIISIQHAYQHKCDALDAQYHTEMQSKAFEGNNDFDADSVKWQNKYGLLAAEYYDEFERLKAQMDDIYLAQQQSLPFNYSHAEQQDEKQQFQQGHAKKQSKNTGSPGRNSSGYFSASGKKQKSPHQDFTVATKAEQTNSGQASFPS